MPSNKAVQGAFALVGVPPLEEWGAKPLAFLLPITPPSMVRAGLSHALHLVTEAAVGVLGVLAFAACVLAWRLAQGPIDVTQLARRAEASLAGPGTQIAIGSAAVAWEGFREAGRALDVRVSDVAVTAPDGSPLARVPQARVTLAIGQLLFGRIVPRTIDAENLVLDLRREQDGSIRLDFGPSFPAAAQRGSGGAEILRELARPAQYDDLPWLSQLASVSVRNARVTMRDAALGTIWQAPQASVDLKRLPGGGVSGAARLDLAVGDVRASLAAKAELGAGGTHVTASTTPVSPAALARASPVFASLAALDAPVRMSLDGTLDSSLAPVEARLDVQVQPGIAHAGRGVVALQGAEASLSATPSGVRLDAMRIAFAPVAGAHGPPPVLTARGEASRRDGRIAAGFTLGIDAMELGDLGLYWPPGTGGGSRGWLVENIGAGHARGAKISGTLDASSDLSDASLTALSGGFAADDVSVAWLKPIPPVTHGRMQLTIDGPDALHIAVAGAVQEQLRVTGGMIRITGLAARHQFGTIDIAIAGPLAEALRLLNHPRLKLLSRRNLDLTDPAGDVAAKLTVKLPLEAKVGMDDIGIGAKAVLSDVHLGNAAAGRALDDGQLTLDVDSDGLKLAGTAAFAGIASNLALDMDFRNGPPDQVLEHATATGKATVSQLVSAGLPAPVAQRFVASGTAGLSVDYAELRDATGSVQLGADLRNATLATPVGWSKKAGDAASLNARLLLRGGKMVGADRLEARGPGLVVTSHAEYSGGQPRVLVLDRVAIGGTDAQGRVAFPEGAPVQVTLRGDQLDLSQYLAAGAKKTAASKAPVKEERGQPWEADIRFGRLMLTTDESFAPLTFTGASDGLHLQRLAFDAGQTTGIHASIQPETGGRRLSVDAADAGAVLTALDVADNLRGGRLSMQGRYDDTAEGAPLSGTATLSEFNLKDAPAIGRLLQALTFYGLVDVLRGPGLHFSKLVAPFRWQARVLHLDEARAFSSSLGLTASGDLDLGARQANVGGTVVPAYFFNQLPGKLPVIGRLFSPEKGGGLFAARYSVRGSLNDPKVSVNPLSALAPGALRGLFGLFSRR